MLDPCGNPKRVCYGLLTNSLTQAISEGMVDGNPDVAFQGINDAYHLAPRIVFSPKNGLLLVIL